MVLGLSILSKSVIKLRRIPTVLLKFISGTLEIKKLLSMVPLILLQPALMRPVDTRDFWAVLVLQVLFSKDTTLGHGMTLTLLLMYHLPTILRVGAKRSLVSIMSMLLLMLKLPRDQDALHSLTVTRLIGGVTLFRFWSGIKAIAQPLRPTRKIHWLSTKVNTKQIFTSQSIKQTGPTRIRILLTGDCLTSPPSGSATKVELEKQMLIA